MQKIEFRAMGCHMLVAIDSESARAADAINQVPTWFTEWEQALSRFSTDSELMQLNQRAGQSTRVSQALWEVLQESLIAARRSGGLVVPHLLNALEASGYDRSFELLQPDSEPRSDFPGQCAGDWQAIELNSRSHSVSLPAGLRLDFGGIAKGWAADRALKQLAPYGPALVDAGGDIALGEPPRNQTGWPIAIGDPLHRGDRLGLLRLAHRGVATSGRDYRKWQRDGVQQHHILDPRTGQPACTDILSATVIAPSAREAETAAKTVLILGSSEGLKWLAAHDELAGLIVRDDGTAVQNDLFSNYLWS